MHIVRQALFKLTCVYVWYVLYLSSLFVHTEHTVAVDAKKLRLHLLPVNDRQYVVLPWHL